MFEFNRQWPECLPRGLKARGPVAYGYCGFRAERSTTTRVSTILRKKDFPNTRPISSGKTSLGLWEAPLIMPRSSMSKWIKQNQSVPLGGCELHYIRWRSMFGMLFIRKLVATWMEGCSHKAISLSLAWYVSMINLQMHLFTLFFPTTLKLNTRRVNLSRSR